MQQVAKKNLLWGVILTISVRPVNNLRHHGGLEAKVSKKNARKKIRGASRIFGKESLADGGN